jgi:hypothetical protein
LNWCFGVDSGVNEIAGKLPDSGYIEQKASNAAQRSHSEKRKRKKRLLKITSIVVLKLSRRYKRSVERDVAKRKSTTGISRRPLLERPSMTTTPYPLHHLHQPTGMNRLPHTAVANGFPSI